MLLFTKPELASVQSKRATFVVVLEKAMLLIATDEILSLATPSELAVMVGAARFSEYAT